ncbi:hypothetical protein Poly30_08080 [Planctomycetes bacterium Poly30]|uniref:Transposase n=1 Tax=Saltatorellus ferox TaxID=2528018 RepID=A0A518EMJ3_9BACT|nr:hypothetical protein Poly30_08080 [Planctomycetes bacterium Poly30]
MNDTPSRPKAAGADLALGRNPPGPEADPEVMERATRRRFTAEYNAKIFQEAAKCELPGELGALLCREGLYSSHLSAWRQQPESHGLNGLKARKRGRTAKAKSSTRETELERENRQLEERLAKAVADSRDELSCVEVCDALGVSRASFYRSQRAESIETPAIESEVKPQSMQGPIRGAASYGLVSDDLRQRQTGASARPRLPEARITLSSRSPRKCHLHCSQERDLARGPLPHQSDTSPPRLEVLSVPTASPSRRP